MIAEPIRRCVAPASIAASKSPVIPAEIVYTITDPPIRFFRRLVPPLRIGAIALDFGFMLTMLSVFILMAIVRALT